MKVFRIFAGFISIFVVLPIWYYLFYRILISVQASELMMFLFWIYIPAGIFVSFVVKITELLGSK